MRSRYFCLLFSLLIPLTVLAQTNYIPPQAFTHKETIKKELDTFFSHIPTYNYVPSLIEHESCISLKHSRCWNSTSQLKSKRELGVGLGQITKTYRDDGSIRFDSLTEMKNRYRNDLREVSWLTIKERPDLQIRMIVLMIRDDWKRLYNVEDEYARLHMVDAAYNGGYGGLQKERRACGLAKDCSPGLWFEHVEKYCMKSKKVLYGNRSACDINRGHPVDVFHKKLPKYSKQYFKEETL